MKIIILSLSYLIILFSIACAGSESRDEGSYLVNAEDYEWTGTEGSRSITLYDLDFKSGSCERLTNRSIQLLKTISKELKDMEFTFVMIVLISKECKQKDASNAKSQLFGSKCDQQKIEAIGSMAGRYFNIKTNEEGMYMTMNSVQQPDCETEKDLIVEKGAPNVIKLTLF